MYEIKQGTAIPIPFFVHDAAGDAVTGLLPASFTKRISKNGAAFAAMTVVITEMENGWYSITLTALHSDTLGILTITFTNAGAKQVNLQWRVEAKLIDDLNDIAVAEVVTGVWTDKLTTYVDGEAGNRLRKLTDLAGLEVTVNDPAATTSSFITNQLGVNLEDITLKFLDGANAEQSKVITAHNTTTGEMTFDEPFDIAPADGDNAITGLHTHSITQISNSVTAAVFAGGNVDGLNFEQFLRIAGAALGGISSGAGSPTMTYKGVNSSLKNRIVASVNGIGDRNAIVYDVTP